MFEKKNVYLHEIDKWNNKLIVVKNFIRYIFIAVTLIVASSFVACGSQSEQKPVRTEDDNAKKTLQGIWVNDLEGNIVFTFKGDTVYYNDSLSTPVAFHIYDDTLYIENHTVTKYPIKALNSTEMRFINSNGDEVVLTKTDKDVAPFVRGEYKGAVALNQGRKIKKDTVMVFNGKHYHAYTQVNPTTYKVYRQTTNSDGLRVESVYYDNIVYIALYEGQQKVFGSNITKAEFKDVVPPAYIEQAVLSEIIVDGAGEKGVRFIAILSIPDSYTNYRVNIDIDHNGKKSLSV